MATIQLVMGPPGSGKSTYCNGMNQFLSSIGRTVAVVNLDPANDMLPYQCGINITELIRLEEVMERLHLGPNGALMYCMEYLEKNWKWLLNKLTGDYYIIDCPGQVELYTHHNSLKTLVNILQQNNMKLVGVHLVDSQCCSDPSKFISAVLMSLSCMVQVEVPHINVLSKMDILQKYDQLTFGIDYYTEVLDLSYLTSMISDNPFFKKFKALNEALIGIIEDYSLVSFVPLTIEDKQSVLELHKAVDKASGYIASQNERDAINNLLLSAVYPAGYQYSKNMFTRESLH